jgi:3,4-dihydroxy 2-butanone 4-phosphate synthase / GTP cyclohydrolase II
MTSGVAEMQRYFDAIAGGTGVMLVHERADGSYHWARVQALSAPMSEQVLPNWHGCVVGTQSARASCLARGMVFTDKPTLLDDTCQSAVVELAHFNEGKSVSMCEHISLPWHVVPSGGAQTRYTLQGCAYDLVRWSGAGSLVWMTGTSLFAEANHEEAIHYAQQAGLLVLNTRVLMRYAVENYTLVTREASALIPMGKQGVSANIYVYQGVADGLEHVAVVYGDSFQKKTRTKTPYAVRVHSECLTGDVFASQRCDCGAQLHQALTRFEREQSGVLLYLRQEGRGIGLAQKIKAYGLQDQGYDTVEANHQLGFDADERAFGVAVQILQDLGINNIHLLTNNPWKLRQLEDGGINVVMREPCQNEKMSQHQGDYLRTKQSKLGHWLTMIEACDEKY